MFYFLVIEEKIIYATHPFNTTYNITIKKYNSPSNLIV